MLALIDVDPLCYSIGSFTNPHPFVKDAEGKPLEMPCSTDAIKGFLDDMIEKITKAANCTDYLLFLSSSVSTNFRDEVAVTEPYKGHRADLERPYHHKTIVDCLLSDYNNKLVIADNREADDDLADYCNKDRTGTVICTIDKDLDCVPGNHYNWKHQSNYYVSEHKAFWFFYYQLLVGDWSTDNILGCARKVQKVYGPKAAKAGQQYYAREGVGPQAAKNILNPSLPLSSYCSTVLAQYTAVWGDKAKDKMVEMANLLYMGGTADKLLTYSDLESMHTRVTHLDREDF